MIIRPGKKSDIPQVFQLIKELAEYENALSEVEITVHELYKDGFGEKPYFRFLVAESSNTIVALSFYWIRYSTWKGPTMHLEDLIVSKKYRKKGIGKALLSNFIKFANSLGAKRIEWAVLNWNTDAISFYEFNGAKVSNEWYITQMNESAIQNFLKKHNGSK